MDVVVRKIRLEDSEGFWSALGSVAREKKYILMTEAPPLESTRAFVKNNIEKNYSQYVAVLDSEIIGWADTIPYQYSTMAHVGGLGIGVIAKYRGKGVGTKLLSSVIEHSYQNGLKRIELEVFADNTAAIALYTKHGFVQEGLKRYARRVDEQYQDIIVMGQYRI